MMAVWITRNGQIESHLESHLQIWVYAIFSQHYGSIHIYISTYLSITESLVRTVVYRCCFCSPWTLPCNTNTAWCCVICLSSSQASWYTLKPLKLSTTKTITQSKSLPALTLVQDMISTKCQLQRLIWTWLKWIRPHFLQVSSPSLLRVRYSKTSPSLRGLQL